MGVEEKNSFNSFSEEKTSQSKRDLQMHSFPKIRLNDSIKNGQVDNETTKFKSTHSQKNMRDSDNESQPWPKVENNKNDSEQKALIDQAFNDGYEIGFKDGSIQEKKRVDSLTDTITKAISDLEAYKIRLLKQAEDSILKLVLAITRKILIKEASNNTETILAIAQNALKMVVNPNDLIIKVNPEDLKTLNQNKTALEAVIGKNAIFRIESDPAISPGGCVIETDFGDLDARIDAQMQMIEKTLMDAKKL